MINISEHPKYRWPTLESVIRKYVVHDDQGRYGIAYIDNVYHGMDTLFAHPIDVGITTLPTDKVGAELASIPSAILMTDTVWHQRPDGSYRGMWYDCNVTGHIPEDSPDLRTLTIVSDLGYTMPDDMAELLLADSDQPEKWNSFWASSLGRKGGLATSDAKTLANQKKAPKGGRPADPNAKYHGWREKHGKKKDGKIPNQE